MSSSSTAPVPSAPQGQVTLLWVPWGQGRPSAARAGVAQQAQPSWDGMLDGTAGPGISVRPAHPGHCCHSAWPS